MMSRWGMLWRVARPLWSSGLFRLSPREVILLARAWWRCRNSFAFLSEVAAMRFGARLALCDDEGPLTYDQLHKQSLALACRLSREDGIGPGLQVGLVGRNGRAFVLGLLACTRLGADVLPLSPDLPVPVMETLLSRQGISLLLHDPDLEKSLSGIAPGVRKIACRGGEAAAREALAPVRRGGELVVLTSGSSGISKGIRRRPTMGQVLPLVGGLLEQLALTMHRPVVVAIPLYHGYGIATMAMALALGAPMQLGCRYEIAELMARLPAGERPFLVSVPTLLARWLKVFSGDRRPSTIITGSAPLSADLCRELLERLGPVLFNLYGSTEGGLIALASPDILARAPGCAGLPLPGNQVRLLDDSWQDVSPGRVGRILVHGPFVIPSREDGWRDTGDLGRFDNDGHLYVCGRADGMIVSGGENVYPHELEEVLLRHPGIVEAAVLVVDDADFGKRLLAAVVTAEGESLEEAELRDWLRQHLERHKLPRAIFVLERIPRNALGKVDKLALERAIPRQA